MTGDPDAPVIVFEAPDESTAEIVADLLSSEGIATATQKWGTTWGGSWAVADFMDRAKAGTWGAVTVLARDEARSLQIIRAYEPRQPKDSRVKLNWQKTYKAWVPQMYRSVTALHASCVAGFALFGDALAVMVVAGLASLSMLLMGLQTRSSGRYVPQQYRAAHLSTGNGMLWAALIFMAVAVMEACAMPRLIVSAPCLMVAALTIGTMVRTPTDTEDSDGQ